MQYKIVKVLNNSTILLDDNGLKYICEKQERLTAINTVLGFMIKNKPSARLVKHIIRSYSRLAENQEARAILKMNLFSFSNH